MHETASPSLTARRVATYRLGFERLDTPYANPAGDEALASDVAGDTSEASSDWMARYLRGRTAFFDRVVVTAIDRGLTQLVSIGAGYDGRALRYAKPGVRWWEVDRAATQADKRARLDRLGFAVEDITFVAHDLTHPGLAEALIEAGFERGDSALFTCEGVAVYLPNGALQLLLEEVRSLASGGTRLAISLGTSAPSSRDHPARRQRFATAVANMGEPALSAVTAEQAAPLLAAARWQTLEISERSRLAGFVIAAPSGVEVGPELPTA